MGWSDVPPRACAFPHHFHDEDVILYRARRTRALLYVRLHGLRVDIAQRDGTKERFEPVAQYAIFTRLRRRSMQGQHLFSIERNKLAKGGDPHGLIFIAVNSS